MLLVYGENRKWRCLKKDSKVKYRKIYPINLKTSRIYEHDNLLGTGHRELPYINIKRVDGTMLIIDITG